MTDTRSALAPTGRIVVTGASGNLGTGLLRALVRDPAATEVVGVCRRPPPPVAPYDRMRWQALDLGAPDAAACLAPIMDGASAVVHLAWAIQPVHDAPALYRTNVEGTRNVLRAVRAAGVPHLVHASTLGVYAPSVGHDPVDESHPDSGHSTSVYSRHKITVERLLDRLERERPDLTVTRIRPTLVVQRAAATEIADLFLGRFVPRALLRALRGGLVPRLPIPAGLSLQFVHADDVGDAVTRILRRRAGGVYNLAAEPLGPAALAAVARARPFPLPAAALRSAAAVLSALRLVAVSPGWFDVATRTPLMDSSRATADLGWAPHHSSAAAARELLDGMADGATGASAALGARAAA